MNPLASIIVCTYNRDRMLKRLLQSLSRQTLKTHQFELIIVNDGSCDNTLNVCNDMRKTMPNLKVISNDTNIGLARAANKGAYSASGDHLLFTDDDCIADENWAQCLCAALGLYPIVAGVVSTPTTNYAQICHNIAEFHAFMPGKKAGPIDFIAGANMGFRSSVFKELGGFNETNRPGVDMEIILRARVKGHRIHFVTDAVVTHAPERTSMSRIFKYAADHASETIVLRNRYTSIMNTPFVLKSSLLILVFSPAIALKVTLGIYLGNRTILKMFRAAPVVYALKLAWCWGAAQGLRNWNRTTR